MRARRSRHDSRSRHHFHFAELHAELATIRVSGDGLGRPPGTFDSQIQCSMPRSWPGRRQTQTLHPPLVVQQVHEQTPTVVDRGLDRHRVTIVTNQQRPKRQGDMAGGRRHEQPRPSAGPVKRCAVWLCLSLMEAVGDPRHVEPVDFTCDPGRHGPNTTVRPSTHTRVWGATANVPGVVARSGLASAGRHDAEVPVSRAVGVW